MLNTLTGSSLAAGVAGAFTGGTGRVDVFNHPDSPGRIYGVWGDGTASTTSYDFVLDPGQAPARSPGGRPVARVSLFSAAALTKDTDFTVKNID